LRALNFNNWLKIAALKCLPMNFAVGVSFYLFLVIVISTQKILLLPVFAFRRTKVFLLRSEASVNVDFQLTFVQPHAAFAVAPVAGTTETDFCILYATFLLISHLYKLYIKLKFISLEYLIYLPYNGNYVNFVVNSPVFGCRGNRGHSRQGSFQRRT